MSRLSALPLAFLVLAACADTPTAPADELAPQFAAVVDHTEGKAGPMSFVAHVPCANNGLGETVIASDVYLHMVSRSNIDAAGGVHLTVHYQPFGNWDGIGQDTGDVYRGSGLTRQTVNYDVADLTGENTYVNNYLWIGPGKGNNYLVHNVFHVTANANGEITAYIDKTWVDCK